ncbi:hypothetical protein C8J56DRAFT_1061912 [Mycena floridula]|nr:hypothetical protein C8J56DRAFT_1061912 [Mycena floridula]
MDDFEKCKVTAWRELWLNYKWFYVNGLKSYVPPRLHILPQSAGLKDVLQKVGKDAILLKQVGG